MRHKHQYVKYFAFLWPIIFLLNPNPWFVYLSFCLFLCLGIELGLHRIVCHGLKVYAPFRYIFVLTGMLTYSGGVKNSALSHFQHHMHTDTAKDVDKKFGIKADFSNMPMSMKRAVLKRFAGDKVLTFMDENHNVLFLSIHILVIAIFGLNGLMYFTIPASMAVWFHDYFAVNFLHKHGYENFKTGDNSKNSLLLYPFMWGANFHNNHHKTPKGQNGGVRWWEIDFIYQLTRWTYYDTDE